MLNQLSACHQKKGMYPVGFLPKTNAIRLIAPTLTREKMVDNKNTKLSFALTSLKMDFANLAKHAHLLTAKLSSAHTFDSLKLSYFNETLKS